MSSISYTLPNGVENLTLTSGRRQHQRHRQRADNVIVGNDGNNMLDRQGRRDTLTGGGGQRHVCVRGRDTRRRRASATLIADFTPGTDRIDLTGIDADTGTAGDAAFRFLGTAAFDGQAGALHTSLRHGAWRDGAGRRHQRRQGCRFRHRSDRQQDAGPADFTAAACWCR